MTGPATHAEDRPELAAKVERLALRHAALREEVQRAQAAEALTRSRLSQALADALLALARAEADGRIAAARIALGGVAHKPWRMPEAEAALQGAAPDDTAFAGAASILLRDARGQGGNDFKIALARRAIVRALRQAAAGTPQSQTDKRIR